jgi:hypothetical protein
MGTLAREVLIDLPLSRSDHHYPEIPNMMSFILLFSVVFNVALVYIAQHYRTELEKAQNCASFGCKTRQWVDRRRFTRPEIVIFLDVDKMKEVNTQFGHNGTNERITAALTACRDSAILSARWQMGDELVAFTQGNGALACLRIESAFEQVGLSVTAAWVERTDDRPLAEWVTPLMDEVMARKAVR